MLLLLLYLLLYTRFCATHEEINLIGTPSEVVAKAMAFKEAGVTHLLGLYFAANSVQELLDQMQLFAEEVMPKVM